jgi:hypothetical protein
VPHAGAAGEGGVDALNVKGAGLFKNSKKAAHKIASGPMAAVRKIEEQIVNNMEKATHPNPVAPSAATAAAEEKAEEVYDAARKLVRNAKHKYDTQSEMFKFASNAQKLAQDAVAKEKKDLDEAADFVVTKKHELKDAEAKLSALKHELTHPTTPPKCATKLHSHGETCTKAHPECCGTGICAPTATLAAINPLGRCIHEFEKAKGLACSLNRHCHSQKCGLEKKDFGPLKLEVGRCE